MNLLWEFKTSLVFIIPLFSCSNATSLDSIGTIEGVVEVDTVANNLIYFDKKSFNIIGTLRENKRKKAYLSNEKNMSCGKNGKSKKIYILSLESDLQNNILSKFPLREVYGKFSITFHNEYISGQDYEVDYSTEDEYFFKPSPQLGPGPVKKIELIEVLSPPYCK